MMGELFPWNCPIIMKLVMQKWPRRLDLSANDRYFVSIVVHNAGVYNGIVAVGLFAAAFVGSGAFLIQVASLVGAIVAGLFGSVNLAKAVFVQALLSAIALAIVVSFPEQIS
jgi:uncharacterized membrane protein